MIKNFSIKKKLVVITGGAGLLGSMHAEAIAEIGGIPLLFDKKDEGVKKIIKNIKKKYSITPLFFRGDVTKEKNIKSLIKFTEKKKIKYLWINK